MSSPIGAVYLAVLPDLSGFARDAARQLAGPIRRAADQAGDQATDALERSGEQAGRGFGSRLASGAKTGLAKLRPLADAAGIGAGAALAAGIAGAMNLESARAKMSAQLGLSGRDSAKAGRVAGSLYAKAYGDSMDEVSDAVTSVIRNMDGLRDASVAALETTTARAITTAKVLDAEVGGVTRAVSQMLRTGLAKSAAEAFDVIVKGAQQGADKAGDLLDSLNEYSVQYAKLGLTGAQAIGLIGQAIRAGARDSDQISDALKEFTLLAGSGTKPVTDAYTALGLSAKEMTAQFGKGGPAAARVLDTVLGRLRTVQDQGTRTNIVTALFGGPGEDLGAALFALDLDKASGSLGRFQGAADSAGKTLGNTSASEFESFKRGLQSNVTGAILDYGVPALNLLKKTGQALGISPSGLVATGAAVAGVALGAKAVASTYGAAKTVVGGASTVIKAAGGAWDSLRLRAMYAGDAARKAGGMVKTAAIATVNAGKAAFATALNLGRMAVGYVRTGLAAAGSAAKQLIFAAASGVVRVATLAWSAAQAVLNVVMSANPLGLIVLGLVALGAALVLAWQRSETFRAIVMAVWNAIKTGVMVAVNALVTGITAAWNWIKNVSAAVWGAIGGVLTGVWKVISTIAGVYIAIYKAIFLGAWWAIRNGAAVAWAVIKATLTGVWKVISTVAKFYIGLYTAIFSGAWWAIRTTASAVWGAIKGVVLGFLGQMQGGFSTAVAAIRRIWSGIKAAAADPVRFVVQTVYTGGIKRIWDWLADKVGLPRLPDAPKFAAGGVLGGYRPGHDSVLAMLSPGEGILRPEAVRYLGAGWIHGMNKAARSGGLGQREQPPGFKFGGIVGSIAGGVGGFIKAGKGLFMKGLVYAARKAFNPILSAAEDSAFGKSGFGQIITRIPRKLVDGILGYFAKNESGWLNKLGPGKVVQVALSQIGQGDRGRENDNKYNDAFGFGPGTAWCANFVSWVLREAGAGTHYPGYPTAAVATYSGAMDKVSRSQARPGDLGFYEGGGRSHINLVVSNDGGSLTTVGGNEGPQVKKSARNDQSSVGRPKYARGGVVSGRDASVFARRDEDPGDRRDPLTAMYRKLGPRTAALVSKALANVRPMATGGLVTRPTLALVGEDGPELVTPLSAKRETPAQRRKRRERERQERERRSRQEKARREREAKSRQEAQKRLRQNLPAAVDKLNPKTTTAAAIKSVTRSLMVGVQKAFKGQVAKRLSGAIGRAQTLLLAKVAKRDAIRGRLQVAQGKLDDLKKAKVDFSGNVAGTARQFGSLTSLGTVYDASDIAAGLSDRLAVLRKFTTNLSTLAKLGLNKGLLRQLYEAGPEQGGAYAQALVEATPKQLGEINATAGAFDTEAARLGDTGASYFYDAGIKAAEGLVKALAKQQAAIEKQMKAITDALLKQIRKALGTLPKPKPRGVPFWLDDFAIAVGHGFGLDGDQATPQVVKATRALTARPRDRAVPTAARDAQAAPPNVRVFIGERELTDIVRVELDAADADLARQLYTRGVA